MASKDVIGVHEMEWLCNRYLFSCAVGQTLKSKADEIKYEARKTLIDFYGIKHSDVISSRINPTEVVFMYQLLGARNSVEWFLKKKKAEFSYQKTGVNCTYECIEGVAEWFEHGLSILKLIKIAPEVVSDVAKAFGYSMTDIMVFNKKDFKKKVLEIYHQWKDSDNMYSDDPDEEADMRKMQAYIDDYKESALPYFARKLQYLGYKLDEEMDVDDFWDWVDDNVDTRMVRAMVDPFFMNIADQVPNELSIESMLIDYSLGGFVSKCNDKTYVVLGVQSDDFTTIHEFNHVADDCGFEKGHWEEDKNRSFENGRKDKYNRGYFRQYEALNEVINDLFTWIMMRHRKATGAPQILRERHVSSLYAPLYPLLFDWVNKYQNQLKEIRLGDNSIEEFMKIVGEEEFERMAQLVHERLVGELLSISERVK